MDISFSGIGVGISLIALLLALIPSFLIWQYLTWRRLDICNAHYHVEDQSLAHHLLWLFRGQLAHIGLATMMLAGQFLLYCLIIMIHKNSMENAIIPLTVALPVTTLLSVAAIWNTQAQPKQKIKRETNEDTLSENEVLLLFAPSLIIVVGIVILAWHYFSMGNLVSDAGYANLHILINLVYLGGLVEYILAPFLAVLSRLMLSDTAGS